MIDANTSKLLEKLDLLIAVTAATALNGKTQREQIEILNRAGLAPSQIARILGTSPNAVSVTLFQLKRRGKKKSTKQ